MALRPAHEHSPVTVMLGPTNTGKTHRAVERLLQHDSGMIGLPLRLLAREIYDRITARVGEGSVALVTGEEKRIPRRPRYWICTVESMPVELEVDFLAVDEVQLCAHHQRGHVFTDRLLRARGRAETWFLGADTMRPLIAKLLPAASVRRYPRLSKLSFAGRSTLATLPPRSAVIAFSADEVYSLADRLRYRRGGAAVVMGALSPRTRNAQVAMYQAGEVGFLVATDAIGMGLNMDVDHVAFASRRKFDGRRVRALDPAELAQIAGRAGRYENDGSFGGLGEVEIPVDVALAIETHRFAPVRRAVWRSSDLDLTSLDGLIATLKQRPRQRYLQLVEHADDYAALTMLAERPEIRERARAPEQIALLWDVCRIPDFRKLMTEHHVGLLAEVFMQLSARAGLDPDWMDQRISRLEDVAGDIDTLLMRMEFIRTWTYITHHPAWVADAPHWQQRTQAAEDRLSDSLHERLIERFVERRMRGQGRRPAPGRGRRGAAAGEHEPYRPRSDHPFSALRNLKLGSSAAPEIRPTDEWVESVVAAEHERFQVDLEGRISDGGIPLGRLARGNDLLRPEVKLTLEQPLGAGAQGRIARRLLAFSRDLVRETLGPLAEPGPAEQLTPAGRGLLYQLEQQLGTVLHRDAQLQVRALTAGDRQLLGQLEVQLGRKVVFVTSAVQAPSIERRVALCAAYFELSPRILQGIEPHKASFPALRGLHPAVCLGMGYVPLGRARAVRADLVERILERLQAAGQDGPFKLPRELSSWLGCAAPEVEAVVLALGFKRSADGRFSKRRKTRRSRKRKAPPSSPGEEAKLP